MNCKLICLCVLAGVLVAAAAPKRTAANERRPQRAELSAEDDDLEDDVAADDAKTPLDGGERKRLAGLFVKDSNSDNGEMRFLTGTGGSSGLNTALNQYITQQQNLLEQLRPSGSSSGTFLSGTGATGISNFGSGFGSSGFGSAFGSTSTNGVTPIVVNLSGSTATGGNNLLQAVATNTSPIGDILPQVIGQAVLGGTRRRPNNNRRVANRRVANNNRRRRPQRNQPKVVLLRP